VTDTRPEITIPVTAPEADRAQREPSHLRLWIAAGVAALIVAGVVIGSTDPFATSRQTRTGVADNASPVSLATVSRKNLSSQTAVDATLGYARAYTVVNQAHGTITRLPAAGQVITQGQVLYRMDGRPVILLYGSTPAYRSLAEGAAASDVTGADVAELNADLVALGYATDSEIPAGSDQFSWWTKEAVEKLQAAAGVTQNGTLALGDVVFLPSAARITTISAPLGGPGGPGQPIMSATSTTRQVTINLDAAQQSEVKVGDKVTITLPNGTITPGVISSVGTVAATPSGSGSNSTPTIAVEVSPTDPAATGRIDQAPVQVSITTSTVNQALVVPVNALVALSNGSYAVEVVDPAGLHHLVDVTLGIFDDADGLVQVSAPGLAAGQHVVIPAP
jgi:hypothetical protein